MGQQGAHFLAPRPDWAPPHPLPPDTIHLYVTGSPSGAWAVTAVSGGDGRTDGRAVHLFDAAGPPGQGVADRTELRATQTAALAALSIHTAALANTSPLLLRVAETYTRSVAGMVTPAAPSALENEIRVLRQRLAQARPVWLAGWRPGRKYWWGDRSAALAAQCTDLSWGPQPHAWTAAPPLPRLAGTTASGAPDDCPVCLEPFTDPLPRPRRQGANLSRSSDVFHGCQGPHAVCVRCDLRLVQAPEPRCVICRRARQPWATLA